MRVADGALDEKRLGRVGEAAGRSGQDLQGAGFVSVVAAVSGGVHDGRGRPVQGVQDREQAGLVVLHRGEQVVGVLVFDQVAGGFPLHMHSIGRDKGTA